MAYKAGLHVEIVLKNIPALLLKKPLVPYPVQGPGGEMIFLTLGPKAGTGFLPKLWGIVLGDFVVAGAKSKGLFISNGRKNVGY